MTMTLDEAKQRWKPVYQDGSTVARDLAEELRGLMRRKYDATVPDRAMPSLEEHLRAWLRNESMAAIESTATAGLLDALLEQEQLFAVVSKSLQEALEEVAR